MKTTTKDKLPTRDSNLKLIHKIIEYPANLLPAPGSLGPPPKGKVIETLTDLIKAFKRIEKLNENAVSLNGPSNVRYYVKSEPEATKSSTDKPTH